MSAPTFSTVDISSNNSIKTNYAGADDTVSINITASASINQPYVVFQSGGAAITNSPSYSGSAAQWTASYTVSSSDTDGAVSFTIDASNANGSVQTTSTTNSTSVTKVGTTTVTTYTPTPQGIIGDDIDGEASGDQSGWSVSLSSDGTIVAIGANQNDGNGNLSGHVRVYQYSNSSWSQLGSDIDGEVGSDQSGWSVSLSSDGTIVAIGAYNNNSASGHVRVYERDTNEAIGWRKLGEDIDGEAIYDQSGYSVSLNSDGTIVAIGAWGNDGNGTYSGHVRVYQYDENKTTAVTDQDSADFGPAGWNRLGEDIDGEAPYDHSGISVSLNSDTSSNIIVAIGARYNGGNGSYSGHVRVYQYDASKETADTNQSSSTFGPIGWNRLGADIDGEASHDWSGQSVSLSSDGTIVAIGANGNDGNGNNSGHVRVYRYDETKETAVTDQSSNTFGPAGWNRLGDDIDAEAADDYSGRSVSLSSDGTIVAIGAYQNDGNGSNSGHVRVYQYDATKTTAVTDQSSNTFGPIGWNRVGEDIDGEAEDDRSGYSVSLSSDGTIVAIGAYQNDGTASNAGHVRVYNTGVPQTNTSTYIAVPPDLTALTIASNNADTTLAKSSDNVTLSLTYDMSINTPIIDISSGGAAIADTTITYATVNDSSLNWTATYTVDSADTDGTVTFAIDASSVQTFTSATQATQSDITSGSNVTIDTTAPTFTLVDLSSNNANSSAAKENDVITLNITASETINTPNVAVSVGGSAVSNTAVSGSGNTFATTYTVGSGDNGSVTFTIDASDNAGNNATQVTATTNSSAITVDTTAPTFSSTVLSSDNSNVTITFSESVYNATGGSGDIEISDFTVSITGGAATNPSFTAITKNSQSVYDLSLSFSNTADGSETLTIVPASATSIYDAAGNAASTSQSNNTASINDKLTPSFTLVDLSSNNSIKTNYAGADDVVSINLTASESINQPYVVFQSGGADITNSPSYSGSGTQWTVSYTVSSSDTDGAVSFTIDASDNDGNTSQRTTTTNSTSVTKVGTTTVTTTTSTPQGIIGSEIDGTSTNEYSGSSVSMNSDGTIVAIGAYGHDSNRGRVRVWEYTGGSWTQLGSDITGGGTGESSGYSVSLSNDGTVLAVGAYGYSSEKGAVRTYKYNGTAWNMFGWIIEGVSSGERFGISCSLNGAGTILAAGANYNNSNTGTTRVYEYPGSGAWSSNQLGSDINGSAVNEHSGISVSLNESGSVLAIGAYGANKTRVYGFASNTWGLLGSEISVNGMSVSLNNDGTIVATGYNGVTIYQYISGSWSSIGSISNSASFFGRKVSLNGDGTILAVGAERDSTAGSQAGATFIYQYISNSWGLVESQINGLSSSERSGFSVSLNDDGKKIAIGAYLNGDVTSNNGTARIYETGAVDYTTSNVNAVPPDLTSLSISSDYTVTTQAKATNEVTISLQYDMSINTPIVDISSGGAAIADTTITYATVNDSSLNWTAAYTVDSADTVGAVTFTIDASSVQTFTDATQATQTDITDGTSMTILESVDPTISSTTLDSFNSNITVTFSESVYANTNGTGDLTTSDFTISVSGGQATSPTLTAISKTSQSIWDLSLSYTGAANGSEQITLNPASTSIYDANANLASTSQSNNTFNLNDIPVISSVVVNKDTGALNTNVTVTFTESVYNTNGGSGDLELSDFTAALSGGVATTPVLSSLTKTSQSVWDMSLSYTGEPAGTETLTINPVSNSIFNASGVEVRNPQSNNTSQLYERWITTDSANYFKNSYVEGFVDVSGSTIRTRGPTDHLLIAGDSSLNNDVTLSSSGMGIGIGDHNNAVDVSGNVDLSGNLFVTGDVSLNDALYVNALSVTGTASYVSTTLNSTNITYNSEVKTTAQVTINESDMSHNNTSQTIHGDLNSSGTFSSDVNLNPAMKLPGNILVVENPNGDYNYGAYTIYSDAYNSKYFAVGKSASHVFNIVNENNAGVYMDNGSTSFTGTSDARLKKNIEPLEDSTDKIDKLNPCTFQWKTQEDDDKRHLGFIAQEVEEVLPELVDENTLLDGSSYKGVKMDDMIPYLLQYVKKLRQKVNSMKKNDDISVSTNGGNVTPFNSESSLDKLDKN